MTVSLGRLHTARKGERLQTVLVDDFAPQAVGLSVGGIPVVCPLVVHLFARGLDGCAHYVGRNSLVPTEVLMIVDIERRRAAARRGKVVIGCSVQFHDSIVSLGVDV